MEERLLARERMLSSAVLVGMVFGAILVDGQCPANPLTKQLVFSCQIPPRFPRTPSVPLPAAVEARADGCEVVGDDLADRAVS